MEVITLSSGRALEKHLSLEIIRTVNSAKISSNFFHPFFFFHRSCKGQLGLGDGIKNVNRPTFLIQDDKVKEIVCGVRHTIVVREDAHGERTLWGFGSNAQGQLGMGEVESATTPRLLMSEKICGVSCGYQHTLIFKENGDLFVFGDNT